MNESGLSYEADSRHCDLLTSSLTLDEKSHAATQGMKPTDRDNFCEKSEDLETVQLSKYANPDAALHKHVSASLAMLFPMTLAHTL